MLKKLQFVDTFGFGLTKHRPWFAIFIILAILIPLSSSLYKNFLYVQTLSIAAGEQTGDSYKFAERMANIVNARQRQIKIKVISTDGTRENLEKLNKGEVQLAAAQADALLFEENINNLQSAQILTLLFPDMYQLIVKSGINSISELRGKRIAQPPEKGGQIQSLKFLMEQYGVDPQLVPVKDTDEDITKAFCQGKVDAVFHVRAIGNNSIEELLKCNGQLLPIDQAGAMRTKNPYVEEAKIPKGVYKNANNTPIPQANLITIRVWRLLLVREDVSPEVIQEITGILYQQRQEFVKTMPILANINPPDNLTNPIDLKLTVLPTHPGAQAYYDREKPSWLQENSGSLEVIFAILFPIISGFWWFTQQIEQAQKNKADDYIREVTTLMDAQDCIETVFAHTNAEKSGGTLQAKQISVIVEKTAKILVEKYQAERDRYHHLISQHSLESFSKTLRKVVNVIEKMPDNVRNEVFKMAPEKAVEFLDERQKNISKNFLPSLLISLNKIIDVISY
ncbi:MAG: TAXI family TRAP transporter solute-binding subunit, partial [Scytonema sp. PMC 1069.18]|nr:TAXI family TRAP transporter solute-binding subunit [Scytonema sp. PMC 1069.18]